MRIQEKIRDVGMLLDLSMCIGCRACQVACKEWNELPIELTEQKGGYENPRALSAETWKQVKFIESKRPDGLPEWLFYSDSCKHCADAPCLAACPTGAIVRTEEGIVVVNDEVCNGNGHCVPACPFGVMALSKSNGVAGKCTFCYERVAEGLETACAQVCPTDCIQFGERDDLVESAHRRLGVLHERGSATASLYGEHELGGLHVLYLLTREPGAYGLPEAPRRPKDLLARGAVATAAVVLCWFLIYFSLAV